MENIEDLIHNLLIECGEVGYLSYEKGWAEANAGNLSIRLNDDITNQLNNKKLEVYSRFEIKSDLSNIKGKYFLVKGSGKRMRDIKTAPEQNLCLGSIIDNLFQIIWPPNCNFKPTSEIETHMAMHNFILKNKPEFTSIFHTHPIEVIELINLRLPNKERRLYEMNPNMAIYLPEGICILSFEVPSSLELAEKTLEKLKKYRVVIWQLHGIICIEHSLTTCFDLIDIINKASYFVLKSENQGFYKLSDKQIIDLKSSHRKMD